MNVNAVAHPEEAAEQAAWACGLGQVPCPLSTGVSMSFLDDGGQERVGAAHGPDKYQRPAALEKVWDPDEFLPAQPAIRPGA